jgi:O-antigen ligase
MIIFSWSRLAVVSLVLVPIVIYLLSNIIRPWMQFLASITCFLSGLFFVNIMNFLDFSQNLVDSLREDSRDSSNTREAIYSLTLDRWKNEAFVWGHGIIGEKGPSATDHYPIGSHNTWYGLLYLHGIVGFIPFFIAIVWTFIDLLIKAQSNRQAKLCLSLLIVILLSSFTDNIQTFAYIFWPALLMLGIQWKQDLSSSSREFNMIPQRQY